MARHDHFNPGLIGGGCIKAAGDHNPGASMIELPMCRWRGEVSAEGRHYCSSPKITHSPNGVRDKLCHKCELCNHPRPPLLTWVRAGARRRWEALRDNPRVRRSLRFAWAFLRHLAAGLPHATEEQQEARRAKCGPCWRRNRETDECTLCGCRLNSKGGKKKLVSKILWAGEQCPMWEPEQGRPWGWGPEKGITIFGRVRRRLWRWLLRTINREGIAT